MTWGGEDFFFYVAEDAAKRPFQVWRHDLGKEQSTDTLIFEEKDELFNLHAWRCKSGAYVFIDSGSSETSEVRCSLCLLSLASFVLLPGSYLISSSPIPFSFSFPIPIPIPIQSNPIQSNPIQSNPIQSNPPYRSAPTTCARER